MLINGGDIRIIHATTGEIIRELILNPAVDYQPRGIRKSRKNSTYGFEVLPMPCEITRAEPSGLESLTPCLQSYGIALAQCR
jgi:hypothetical protein